MSIQALSCRRENFPPIFKPLLNDRRQRIARQSTARARTQNRLGRGRSLLLTLCYAVLLLGFTSSVTGQEAKVTIQVLPASAGRIEIEGESIPTSLWLFRDNYAGVMNLGSRIEGLRLFDRAGAEIPYRKIAPGQFESVRPAMKFRYEVKLAPPSQGADGARVSWLNNDRGLLMLGDLLPAFSSGSAAGSDGEKARDRNSATHLSLRLALPEGWVAHTSEAPKPVNEFAVADSDGLVIAVGHHLRVSTANTAGATLSLVVAGEWAFADSDALDLAVKAFKAHADVFGGAPHRRATLILFPFPETGPATKWSAETRGPSVTLLIGKLPSKIAALAQLSVPLTHEFLHFWVPHGLALSGDYDWFYEGFTIYQAARASVRLDLLTFPEFLNAIGRAYDAYRNGLERDRWSLVEASKRRWTSGEATVYSKSMVIAFLYDLNVRLQSRNKRSLDDVYRVIFRAYAVPETFRSGSTSTTGRKREGNEAVMEALDSVPGVNDFGTSFIRKPVTINLHEQLAPFGLQVETMGLRTYIAVSQSLTRQQRDLLHELGYNDYVRSPRLKQPL